MKMDVDDNGRRYKGCEEERLGCIKRRITRFASCASVFYSSCQVHSFFKRVKRYVISIRLQFIQLLYNFRIHLWYAWKNATIISSLADVRLQSPDAGGEEIFSTLRNDEILERKYVLIIEGIITRHGPGFGTLTNEWVETIKMAIFMDQINRGVDFLSLTLGRGHRSQDGTSHCSPKLMCALIRMKKQYQRKNLTLLVELKSIENAGLITGEEKSSTFYCLFRFRL